MCVLFVCIHIYVYLHIRTFFCPEAEDWPKPPPHPPGSVVAKEPSWLPPCPAKLGETKLRNVGAEMIDKIELFSSFRNIGA